VWWGGGGGGGGGDTGHGHVLDPPVLPVRHSLKINTYIYKANCEEVFAEIQVARN